MRLRIKTKLWTFYKLFYLKSLKVLNPGRTQTLVCKLPWVVSTVLKTGRFTNWTMGSILILRLPRPYDTENSSNCAVYWGHVSYFSSKYLSLMCSRKLKGSYKGLGFTSQKRTYCPLNAHWVSKKDKGCVFLQTSRCQYTTPAGSKILIFKQYWFKFWTCGKTMTSGLMSM